MLVPAFWLVVSLQAQFGVRVPDESRSPMAIRPSSSNSCKLSVGGEAWVGKATVKGGAINVHDLTGAGV